MKIPLTRRTFIASAAASIIPSAVTYGQPKGEGLLSLLPRESQSAADPKTDWKNAGVIDLTNSPYAKLKTVPVRAVTIREWVLVAAPEDQCRIEHTEHAR